MPLQLPISRRRFGLFGLLALTIALRPLAALDFSDPAAAETELEALVAEWESAAEEQPASTTTEPLARSLQALGIVERQLGKTAEARAHLERACRLMEKTGSASLPDAREALALATQDAGDLGAAESLLRRVLETRRDRAENAPLALATTLDHLALNLLQQGRYEEVTPLIDEALAATPASEASTRARLLGHRGRLHHTLGSHARAVSLFQEALALGPGDPGLTLSLRSQLALSRLRLGEFEAAERDTEAVAEEARELFDDNLIEAVPYLNNLGGLSLTVGNPEQARRAFAESLDVLRERLGEDHPGLITPYHNLGVALQQLGDYPGARDALQAAARLQTEHLPDVHLRVAETRRNLARNALLSGSPDAAEQVADATHLGLELLDRLVAEGSETERLNFLERFDLVSLPCATGDPSLIANVLVAGKGRLLDAMLDDGTAGTRPTWRDVQRSLPEGAAFIDACRFQPLEPGRPDQYGAILLLPDGPPRWIRLGSEEDLTHWLGALRERLSWRAAELAGEDAPRPTLKMATILRALERGFWKPVTDMLPGSVEHLAFSPDGALHFLPLAALLDTEGIPLSHRFHQIAHVTSGRSLLESRELPPLEGGPWAVVTIDDFPRPNDPPRGTPLLELLAELPPIPGTREEAEKLRGLAPDGSRFLHDEEATEPRLRELSPAPRVLHLGCHGFFLAGQTPAASPALDFHARSDLLRSSGLVLYEGARRKIGGPTVDASDDLLFPAEIARLPLDGTRLVTLSSCDSGGGTPVEGEGLLGLRRAFSLAGAREVAVALWPVSDATTPDFMERFYRLALASDRSAQALWQAQGEFIPRASDPGFEAAVLRYASFALTQDAPLATGGPITPRDDGNPLLFRTIFVIAGILAIGFVVFRRLRARRHPRRMARDSR